MSVVLSSRARATRLLTRAVVRRYGYQPSTYVAGWKVAYAAIKAIAPDTIFVWSPNTGYSYPYGYSLSAASAADQLLLDTNGDGELSIDDDAYSPYYPGDDYVDWAGMSYYQKGTSYPYEENEPMAAGYLQAVLDGNSPDDLSVTPFYSTYCSNVSRPCAFSEAGTAYHVNTTSTDGDGVGQLALEQDWWRSIYTNASFFEEYPWLKMVQLFEFEKVENDETYYEERDYRLTYNSTVRESFLADISSEVPDLYQWATSQTIYDGNDGTSEPVASEAASFPAGYTQTYASSDPAETGSVATTAAAAGATTSAPSLFSDAHKVNTGSAWVGMLGTVAMAAVGAVLVW